MNQRKFSIGKLLMSVNRRVLYLILILASAIPLFFTIKVPDQPDDSTIDLYAKLMSIPEGSTVLLSSGWTLSTRGENMAQFDAILKVLMRRHIKFALFSISDLSAPKVAAEEISQLNLERVKKGLPPYQRWNDWVSLGFFPNGDGTSNAMTVSLKKAFEGKEEVTPNGAVEDVFKSPVLAGHDSLSSIPLLIGVESTAATTTYIQKLGGKIPIVFTVTGVMGPEALPYYSSGQVAGVAIGLKGALDLETLLQYGINEPGPDGKVMVASQHHQGQVPGFPDSDNNFGSGQSYFPTLHVSLALLILAVLVGNVGMYMQRKGL